MTEHAPANPYRLLTIPEAAQAFTTLVGQPCSERQMRSWASPDRRGRRKLPFAPCPLTGRVVITEAALVEAATAPCQRAVADWRKNKGRR
jgi:hypothetical protein